MMPNVPTIQATVKTQRNSLSRTMATYFQSSTICGIKLGYQGPVVQNFVSLMSSVRHQLVKMLTTYLLSKYTVIFC